MKYNSRVLKKGDSGDDVVELQIRLSGFMGGVPDGDFGPATEKSVNAFKKDFMKVTQDGIVDDIVYENINDFGMQYEPDFDTLKCPCSTDVQFHLEQTGPNSHRYNLCDGFGNNKYKDVYRDGKPKIEMYNKREYPGIHRSLLWAYMATIFYFPQYEFTINSCYRCSERNRQKGRFSTNHCGKAIDLAVPRTEEEGYYSDRIRCNEIRRKLVDVSCAQIGWNKNNKKSLEPEYIAPNWIHLDVRNFNKKYLKDEFFCKNTVGLFNNESTVTNNKLDKEMEKIKPHYKEFKKIMKKELNIKKEKLRNTKTILEPKPPKNKVIKGFDIFAWLKSFFK